jgi:hypothetical protein
LFNNYQCQEKFAVFGDDTMKTINNKTKKVCAKRIKIVLKKETVISVELSSGCPDQSANDQSLDFRNGYPRCHLKIPWDRLDNRQYFESLMFCSYSYLTLWR